MDDSTNRNRPLVRTPRPDLRLLETDDGSSTLVVAGTENSFHSAAGAVLETEHVYLLNSGVADRLAARETTSVLEVGLGTGWGALLTVDRAIQTGAALQMVSLEVDWPPVEVLRMLDHQRWLKTQGLTDEFLEFRHAAGAASLGTRSIWRPVPNVQLEVAIDSVLTWQPPKSLQFHAIYYDPFAPPAAPQLWSPPALARLRPWLHSQGHLTTYACARQVREAFATSGWSVQRVPGPPGGKREVLVARPAAAAGDGVA